MSKKMESPFSNGTEAMNWIDENCDRCVKAYRPKADGEYPSFNTMKQYCSIGKECKFKFAIDIGFITGEVPSEIVDQIGRREHGFISHNCLHYSDNDDDGYKPKPRPKPDGPLNQMVMPFIIEQTLNETKKCAEQAVYS